MHTDLLHLRKFVAPEIIFGVGARKLASRYAQLFSASRILIVTDQGVIDAGWVEEILEQFKEQHLEYEIFSNICPNPRSGQVMEGALLLEETGCNLIVSIGGGSPMDCAKAIGIVHSHARDILEFEGVDKITKPVPPLIFIPTTAGSSSDVSQFTIITNVEGKRKVAIVSKALVPDIALVDPETTTTMDDYLTACTGIDAMVHAIEAYVSMGSGPLTDCYALDAITLIWHHLPGLLHDRENMALRERVMLASMKAGLAFSNAGLGAVHAMAHSLGGFLDLPHGECNAMLLDFAIDYNYQQRQTRYRKIAQALDIETHDMKSLEIKQTLLSRIRWLKHEVGITGTLGSRGVKDEDIPMLAQKALKDSCMLTNPRKPCQKDIERIFHEAM